MSVQVNGINKVLADIQKRLGSQFADKVAKEALEQGAKVVSKHLKQEFEGFKASGESVKEITISDIMKLGNLNHLRIHWKGPMGRYRIIHLNEWGTVKNPRPRGFGAIARSMEASRDEYKKIVKKSVEKYL